MAEDRGHLSLMDAEPARNRPPLGPQAGDHELQRLNWALGAYAESVSMLARSASPEELMSLACRSIVAQSVYVLALVSMAEPSPGKPIRIVARAGRAASYADGLDRSWAEGPPHGDGPTGLAIRSGAPYVMRDAQADPAYAPWREGAACYGIRSSVAVPFRWDGEVIGVLEVYASQPDAFGSQELNLFERLGDQLAVAISTGQARQRLEATEEARRDAEEAVRRERDFSDAVIRSLPGIFYMYDEDLRLIRWNDNLERVVGRTSSEIALMKPKDFVVAEDRARLYAAIDEVFQRGDSAVEASLVTKDGRALPYFFTGVAVTIGDRKCFVGIGIDLTRRYAAERTAREMQAQLARLGRLSMLGEFAATIAHEVNQPLAAIVANCDASVRWLAAHPPNLDRAREAVSRIISDANRAHEVIKRTRSLAIRGGPDFADIDLNDAIREIVLMTGEERQKSRVTVVEDLDPDLPRVRGNRIELQQVVLNLLMNSIEAMQAVTERERVLTVRTEVESPGTVRVSVGDTGDGFDTATAERLFEHFFTTKEGGTGLGLRISRAIAEAHGGRLWASRGEPHGALFQFTLPTGRTAKDTEDE